MTVAEAQFAQGDLVRAVQTIIRHGLPLTSAGAQECERIMRDIGVGNTAMWGHPHYLGTTIHLAQVIIEDVRGAEASS